MTVNDMIKDYTILQMITDYTIKLEKLDDESLSIYRELSKYDHSNTEEINEYLKTCELGKMIEKYRTDIKMLKEELTKNNK